MEIYFIGKLETGDNVRHIGCNNINNINIGSILLEHYATNENIDLLLTSGDIFTLGDCVEDCDHVICDNEGEDEIDLSHNIPYSIFNTFPGDLYLFTNEGWKIKTPGNDWVLLTATP